MNQAGTTIRRMTRADAAGYREFRLLTLRRFPLAFTSHVEDEAVKPLSWYADRIAPSGTARHFMLAAFAAERVVGSAGLSAAVSRNEAHKAEIFGVAVDEEFQRQGVGDGLMRGIIAEARALTGLRQLILSVSDGDSAACRLYERSGFTTYGIEPAANFINGRAIDKRLMFLKLM